MTVLMFYPRFWPLIESGAKCQTIRPVRKRPVNPGDALSLRAWLDKPYRSKQRVLREARCSAVLPIRIGAGDDPGQPLWVKVGETILSLWALDELAKDDGFADRLDMGTWWRENRYLPFGGVLIQWEGSEANG